MESIALLVYIASLVVLFLKYFATALVQAQERFRSASFRYAEDAAEWKGCVAPDTERCARAQRVLLNDSESQPFFMAFGAAYVALGAWPTGAPYYFGAYALSRVAHAAFLIRGRQPHRNRAFSFGLAILIAMAAHVAYEAVGRCL